MKVAQHKEYYSFKLPKILGTEGATLPTLGVMTIGADEYENQPSF